MENTYRDIIRRLAALGGEPIDVHTGSKPPDCDAWWTWGPARLAALRMTLAQAQALVAWSRGKNPMLALAPPYPQTTVEIRGIYRCPPENERRGGTPGSRHQFGEGAGEPFGAIDVRFGDNETQHIREHASEWPEFWRAMTGLETGTGLIVYPTGTVHLDVRKQPDFVDVQ